MKRIVILTAAVLITVMACSAGERTAGDPAPDPAVESAVSPEERGRAERLLEEARRALDAGELERADSLAVQVVERHSRTEAATGALWVAARAGFHIGAYEAAAERAERYAERVESAEAEAEARALASEARVAAAEPTTAFPVLGVIVPQSGSQVLERYGELILEGVRLAVEEYEAATGDRVRLEVVDDGADPRRAARLVSRLERRGVVGIVGPVLGAEIAARGRSNESLVLVSPTDRDPVAALPNAYSLNAGDVRGAEALAQYAAEAGIRRAAMMYPRSAAFIRKVDAFRRVFEGLGGEVVRHVPYDSGTTTFEEQMLRVLEAKGPEPYGFETEDSIVWLPRPETPTDPDTVPFEPFGLFAPATPRGVRQIAPQIEFYGVDSAGVQVFGDEAWTAPDVQRLVGPRALEGVIATTPRDPGLDDGYADPVFIRRYEERFRRTLDNPLPALGYDAAHLLLSSMPSRRISARAVARRVALTEGLDGATGILSVYDGEVVRRPFLVEIREGRPRPVPPPELYVPPQPKPPPPDTTTQEPDSVGRGGVR